jgi:hypothetical protein
VIVGWDSQVDSVPGGGDWSAKVEDPTRHGVGGGGMQRMTDEGEDVVGECIRRTL